VPVLLEENAMETIEAWGFVRFHGVKNDKYFTFGNGLSERVFSCVING